MAQHDEVVATSGGDADWVYMASTRPIQAAGNDHTMAFTRSALEDMADQVNRTGIWKTVEHLRFLPPLGVVKRAEVRDAADGEAEIFVQDVPPLPVLTYADDWGAFKGVSGVVPSKPPEVEVQVGFCRRNFSPPNADDIEEEIGDSASPFEEYSELPLLVFAVTIPVLWGVKQFAGAFLSRLGEIAAEEFAASIKRWVQRSRDPSRTCVLTIEFQLPDGASINGFVLAGSEGIEDAVSSALSAAGDLATLAGIQNERDYFTGLRQAAFFLTDEGWQLGWWTDGERVFQTKWFKENPPDVEGVLGRKPFWEMSDEELAETQRENLERYLQAQQERDRSPG